MLIYSQSLSRSQWQRGLRPRSAAARMLRRWVRIQTEAWMFVVSVVRCQVEVSCDELITRQEEPYRLWCVVVCDLETSWMRRPWLLRQKQTQSLNYAQKVSIVVRVKCARSGISATSQHNDTKINKQTHHLKVAKSVVTAAVKKYCGYESHK
jgi:hypothetical protein